MGLILGLNGTPSGGATDARNVAYVDNVQPPYPAGSIGKKVQELSDIADTIGDASELETVSKEIVGAINEIVEGGDPATDYIARAAAQKCLDIVSPYASTYTASHSIDLSQLTPIQGEAIVPMSSGSAYGKVAQMTGAVLYQGITVNVADILRIQPGDGFDLSHWLFSQTLPSGAIVKLVQLSPSATFPEDGLLTYAVVSAQDTSLANTATINLTLKGSGAGTTIHAYRSGMAASIITQLRQAIAKLENETVKKNSTCWTLTAGKALDIVGKDELTVGDDEDGAMAAMMKVYAWKDGSDNVVYTAEESPAVGNIAYTDSLLTADGVAITEVGDGSISLGTGSAKVTYSFDEVSVCGGRTTANGNSGITDSGVAKFGKIVASGGVWGQRFNPASNVGTTEGITFTNVDGVTHINGTSTVGYFEFPQSLYDFGATKVGKWMIMVKVVNNPDNLNLQVSSKNGRFTNTKYSSNDNTQDYGFLGEVTDASRLSGEGFGLRNFGGSGTVFNDVQLILNYYPITEMGLDASDYAGGVAAIKAKYGIDIETTPMPYCADTFIPGSPMTGVASLYDEDVESKLDERAVISDIEQVYQDKVGYDYSLFNYATWKSLVPAWKCRSHVYAVGDIVQSGDIVYICTVAHTTPWSGTISLNKFAVYDETTAYNLCLNKDSEGVITVSQTAHTEKDTIVSTDTGITATAYTRHCDSFADVPDDKDFVRLTETDFIYFETLSLDLAANKAYNYSDGGKEGALVDVDPFVRDSDNQILRPRFAGAQAITKYTKSPAAELNEVYHLADSDLANQLTMPKFVNRIEEYMPVQMKVAEFESGRYLYVEGAAPTLETNANSTRLRIAVKAGDIVFIKAYGLSTTRPTYIFTNQQDVAIGYGNDNYSTTEGSFKVSEDGYLYINNYTSYLATPYLKLYRAAKFYEQRTRIKQFLTMIDTDTWPTSSPTTPSSSDSSATE